MPVYEYLCNDCGPFTDMRPMAECDDPQDCPQCESRIAARDPDRAGVLLHAVGQAQSHATNERSAHAPKTLGRIQGLARPRLRLLFDGKKAGAAGDQDQERRQGLSDRASLDDQPLKRDPSNSNQNKRRSNASR